MIALFGMPKTRLLCGKKWRLHILLNLTGHNRHASKARRAGDVVYHKCLFWKDWWHSYFGQKYSSFKYAFVRDNPAIRPLNSNTFSFPATELILYDLMILFYSHLLFNCIIYYVAIYISTLIIFLRS